MHNQHMTQISAGAADAGAEASGVERWTTQVEEAVHRLRYRAKQYTLTLSLGIPGRLWSAILSPRESRLDRRTAAILQRRYDELLERDLTNAADGHYPRSLLYQFPLLEYLRLLPEALIDLPRFLLRSYQGKRDDLPSGIERERYPHYYLRTFHWQTDGWLSSRSARLYDASVEFLFAGTADVMRRMAIPPVVEATRRMQRPRVLDVGCGTGRFLVQLRQAVPHAKVYGLDLSPFYLQRAGMLLGAAADVSLVADNAESMPFANGFFDVITSVFLFHELPSDVRRRVIREACRVLTPGGALVLCDSAQLADSPEIAAALYAFAASYHEPYYKGYVKDDLAALMRECGFEVRGSEPYLVSKVTVGRKPSRGGARRARCTRR
jgi:ubiquinone/menaquinone biosynthesis C-methylase UbiE